MGAFFSCSPAGKNKTGHEFMPDMVHPVGYEANYYDFYSYNRWGNENDYKKFVTPRVPVKGTIARGAVGTEAGVNTPNGSVPYYYGNTEDERSRAAKEIVKNPFPITKIALERGKKLFDINCAICHGANADGQGYLARDGGKYPVQPANFQTDTFYKSSNGRFYHAIMYGKNAMGSYSDKLSYEERWDVIHYVRSLQAKAKKLQYDEHGNTFNIAAGDLVAPRQEIPESSSSAKAIQVKGSSPKNLPVKKTNNPKH